MQGQIYKIYSDSYFVKIGEDIAPCKIREVLKKQRKDQEFIYREVVKKWLKSYLKCIYLKYLVD